MLVYCFLYCVNLSYKQVLLTLPEPHRANYSHLSSNPLLMLEQLLMNMKVDWATVAVQTLQQLLTGQEIGFTMDEVDSLLSRYAGKALDFPYSLREKRSGNCQHTNGCSTWRKTHHTTSLVLISLLLLSWSRVKGIHVRRESSLLYRRALGPGGSSRLTKIKGW